MSKNPKSLADRLILLVARLGERATVQNITGRHLVGVEFGQAKQDAKDLVVWEKIYQVRQRRPGWGAQYSRKASTTGRLTKAGIWRAAQLGVPYRHDLVATLLAEKDCPTRHSRSEKQRDAETAALVADGKEYRRQIAARKDAKDAAEKSRLVGPRRKRTARHYEKLNKFLVSRGKPAAKVPAFGNGLTLRQIEDFRPAVPASQAPAYVAPSKPPTPAQPKEESYAAYLDRIQNRPLAAIQQPMREFNNLPKPADPADDARILALFKNDPYGGELLTNGKIRYDNRDWTLQGWEKERFKQTG